MRLIIRNRKNGVLRFKDKRISAKEDKQSYEPEVGKIKRSCLQLRIKKEINQSSEGKGERLFQNIKLRKEFFKVNKLKCSNSSALRPQSRSKSLLSLHSESPKCKQYFRNLKTIEKDIQTEGKSFIHFKRTSHKPRCVLSSRFDVGKNLKYSDSIITNKILSKEIVKQPVFKKPLILIEDQSEYFIEEDESISEQCTNKFVTFADVKQY